MDLTISWNSKIRLAWSESWWLGWGLGCCTISRNGSVRIDMFICSSLNNQEVGQNQELCRTLYLNPPDVMRHLSTIGVGWVKSLYSTNILGCKKFLHNPTSRFRHAEAYHNPVNSLKKLMWKSPALTSHYAHLLWCPIYPTSPGFQHCSGSAGIL